MTLTLDEVRKTRFHMARRNGYEVLEVDSFVDKIEATIAAMDEENATLKQQVEALQKGGSAAAPAAASAPQSDAEVAKLRDELAVAKQDAERAKQEADRAKQEAEQARRDGQDKSVPAPAPAADHSAELEQLRRENADLKAKLASQPAPQASAAMAAVPQPGKSEHLVVTTSDQASPAVVRLVQLATQQAEQVVREANDAAKRTVDDANRQAHEITVDAKTRAERTESEARVNADKMTAEAQSRANNLDKETADKRQELFRQLESERDQLRHDVAQLRGFESDYRSNLTKHLQSQIETIKSSSFEPGVKPTLLSGGKSEDTVAPSSTPRLDALLSDEDKH